MQTAVIQFNSAFSVDQKTTAITGRDGLLNPNQLIVFLGRNERRQNNGLRSTQQVEKFIRGNVTGEEKTMGP